MAHLNRHTATRILGAGLSMIALCAGGSVLSAPAFSAPTSKDVPLQPLCGPDPLTLIDPCESLPTSSEPTAGQTEQIPWDVIDSVLFG